MLTATGSCPYRCPFCSASAIWEGRRRARSPKSVVGELRQLQERLRRRLRVLQRRHLHAGQAWVRELLEEMETLEAPLTWGCATRVDLVDAELLAEMAAARLRRRPVRRRVGLAVDPRLGEAHQEGAGPRRRQRGASRQASRSPARSWRRSPTTRSRRCARPARSCARSRDARQLDHAQLHVPVPRHVLPRPRRRAGPRRSSPRSWAEYDAKHVVMETRHLSAAEIQAAVEEIARELGLRKTTA